MKTRLAIYRILGVILLLLCSRAHAQNAQFYSGVVGQSPAEFTLSWLEQRRVTGSYFHTNGKSIAYQLEGSNPSDGILALKELTNGKETASISLIKSTQNGKIVWTGTMQNTGGRKLPVSFSRRQAHQIAVAAAPPVEQPKLVVTPDVAPTNIELNKEVSTQQKLSEGKDDSLQILPDHTTVDSEAPSWVSSAFGLAVTVHQEQSRKYYQHSVLSFHDLRTRKVFATLPCPARITVLEPLPGTTTLLVGGGPNNKDATPNFSYLVDAQYGKIIAVVDSSEMQDGVIPACPEHCKYIPETRTFYTDQNRWKGREFVLVKGKTGDGIQSYKWQSSLEQKKQTRTGNFGLKIESWLPELPRLSRYLKQAEFDRQSPNWAESTDVANDSFLRIDLGETTAGIFRKDTAEIFIPLTSQEPKLRQWAFSRDGSRIMHKYTLNNWYHGDPDESSFDPEHLIQEKVQWGETTKVLDDDWVDNVDSYLSEGEERIFSQKRNKVRDAWVIRGTSHPGIFGAYAFTGIQGQCQTWKCTGSSMGYYACAFRTRIGPGAAWKESFNDTSKGDQEDSTAVLRQDGRLFHDMGIIKAGGDNGKEYIIGIYNGGRLALQDLATHEVLYSKIIDRYQSFAELAISPLEGIVGVPLSGNGLQLVKVTVDLKFEVLAQLWVTGEDAWAMVLPDGRYAMSAGNIAALDLRKNGVSYPLEDFDLRLNQPEAVAKALGADETTVSTFANARKQRLARMGNPNVPSVTAATAITTPIKILLSEPLPLLHDQSELTIIGKAEGPRNVAANLHLFVNDVPIFGRSGLALQGDDRERSFTVKAPLGTGHNKVQLQIRDSVGGLSLFTTSYVHRSAINVTPKRWVLSIGVSDYVNNELDLTYAAKDANDMADALASTKGRFKDCEKIVLTDAQVTREGIKDAAKALIQSRPEDEIIVYLAGHGIRDDKGAYYYCPHDFDVTNPAAHGLSYDALEGIFQGVPALSRLILMDTCQSGEISLADEQKLLAQINSSAANPQTRGVKARALSRLQLYKNPPAAGKSEEIFLDLRRSCGATVLSAAGAMEYAMESESIKNGLFTYATLKTLTDYDRKNPSERYLTATQLVRTVASEVITMTGGLQKPQARFVNLASDFPIIYANWLGDPKERALELLKTYHARLNQFDHVHPDLMKCYAEEVAYFGKTVNQAKIYQDNVDDGKKYARVGYTLGKIHTTEMQQDGSCIVRYKLHFNHVVTLPDFERNIQESTKSGELEMQATLKPFGSEWKITGLKAMKGK